MTVTINGTTGIAGVDGSAATPAVQGVDTNTGLFFPAADTIAFAEGGTEAMRIDSSGRVGIGTTSPSTILNAYNATSTIIAIDGDSETKFRASRYSTDATKPQLDFRKARGTLASPTAVATSDEAGGIQIQAYGGTNFRNIGRIDGIVETYTSDSNIAGALRFLTNNSSTDVTERLRIASAGQIGIGGANYGTSGQVLTSGGAAAAPSWTTPSTGSNAWTLIQTQTASASASIDFTGLSGYSRLRLSAQDISVSSTGTDHILRLSSDNGVTFISSSSYNNKSAYPSSVTATGYVSSNDGFFALHPPGNGTYTGLAYEMLIENFNIAQRTILYGPSSKQSTGATERIMFSSQTGLTAMNAIRILQSSGTITTGTFILEGIEG